MNSPSSARRVALTLPDDPAALGALVVTVDHTAQQAGLSAEKSKQLAAATEAAYRATFGNSKDRNATIAVFVEEYRDRLEIIFESAHPHSAALESPELMGNVDRVRQENVGGVSRIVLVKQKGG